MRNDENAALSGTVPNVSPVGVQTWYRLPKYKPFPEPVEVLSETEHTVEVPCSYDPAGTRKERKRSDRMRYFRTEREAVEFSVERERGIVESLKGHLQQARSRMGAAEALLRKLEAVPHE